MAIRTNPRLYFVIKKILDAKKKGGGCVKCKIPIRLPSGENRKVDLQHWGSREDRWRYPSRNDECTDPI